jgi:SpoVK/Ycf46/Vps4 family AAA+-type ATPase
MDSYERFVLRRYAANILSPGPGARKPSYAMVRWLGANAPLLGLGPRFKFDLEDVFDENDPVPPGTRNALAPILAKLRETDEEPPRSTLQGRLDWLARTLDLRRIDAEILGAALRCVTSRPFGRLVVAAGHNQPGETVVDVRAISRAIRKAHPTVAARLQPGMPLRVMGLLDPMYGRDDWVNLSRTVLRVARLRHAAPEVLHKTLLGARQAAALDWADFDHLGSPRDLAERLFGAALGTRPRGVNLLLHGAPGTGKTEFVRTLAGRLDAHAVFVGETDDGDAEPSRADRISAFILARAVAGPSGRTLLVMDEADDVFLGVDDGDAEGRRGSKVFMNRLVETTKVPVIWITNAPERLGPAVLRRMDLAIGFTEPGRAIRNRMLGRVLERRRLKLGPAEIERLSALETSPAVIDRALRVAKLVKGRGAEAELAAQSIATLMKGRAMAPASVSPIRFDPALSAADTDLVRLAERAASSCGATGRLDVSFCLHGPSGTGKSAYARHLATRLGLDVLEKRASDLISPYLGQTEAQIAAAFREAADKRVMLVLDEADSLLRDRAGAQRSWEVSQVNEMLTWMERHPYPFVCTTNLMDSIDPATLRRFVFKVRFQPMNRNQAAAAFRSAFGLAPPPGLASLDRLTPGDFAVAARKAAVLGERDAGGVLELLRAEVAAKPGGEQRRVGFQIDR